MSQRDTSKQIAAIVIPTYNEADNIGKMIEYFNTKTFPPLKTKWDLKILVVDDTSPDKTYEIVQKLQEKYSNLHLVINPVKLGMGNAIAKGFHYAIEN